MSKPFIIHFGKMIDFVYLAKIFGKITYKDGEKSIDVPKWLENYFLSIAEGENYKGFEGVLKTC